jgi:hypothetical protein
LTNARTEKAPEGKSESHPGHATADSRVTR